MTFRSVEPRQGVILSTSGQTDWALRKSGVSKAGNEYLYFLIIKSKCKIQGTLDTRRQVIYM